MARTTIKDFSGKILAYVDEMPNGDKYVYDFYDRQIGRYDKFSNTTRDFYNRIVAQGEVLGLLIKGD